MQKWEYALLIWWQESMVKEITGRVEFTDQPEWVLTKGDGLMATLKRLGNEGWELVTVDNTLGSDLDFYLKRPKP